MPRKKTHAPDWVEIGRSAEAKELRQVLGGLARTLRRLRAFEEKHYSPCDCVLCRWASARGDELWDGVRGLRLVLRLVAQVLDGDRPRLLTELFAPEGNRLQL